MDGNNNNIKKSKDTEEQDEEYDSCDSDEEPHFSKETIELSTIAKVCFFYLDTELVGKFLILVSSRTIL